MISRDACRLAMGSRGCAFASAILGVVLGAIGCAESPASEESPARAPYPALFDASHRCSRPKNPIGAAVQAERQARLRRDRYPYDPREGVRAVRELGIAAACFGLAGHALDAERVQTLAHQLRSQVSTDYAASRLNLARAISSRDWHRALEESRRLQLLTSHIGGHTYVDWLRHTNGRAYLHTESSR